jgi:hypothetical protein
MRKKTGLLFILLSIGYPSFCQTDTIPYFVPAGVSKAAVEFKPAKSFFLGGSLLVQAALSPLKPGVEAVSSSGQTEDVKVAAGGGFGIEAFGGQKLGKGFRFVGTLGFQLAEGIPAIRDWTIEFRKVFASAVLQYEIPVGKAQKIIAGAGPYFSFSNRLHIKTNLDTNLIVNFKPILSLTGHLRYEYMISDKLGFYAGIRYQGGTLLVDNATFQGFNILLNQSPKFMETFDKKDASAIGLELGILVPL